MSGLDCGQQNNASATWYVDGYHLGHGMIKAYPEQHLSVGDIK